MERRVAFRSGRLARTGPPAPVHPSDLPERTGAAERSRRYGRPGLPVALTRRLAVAGVVAGVLAGLAVLGPVPVAARAGDPGIAVEAVHPLGDGTFHLVVELVDGNGGQPVSGAALTVTPTGPSGASGAAATLEPAGEGVYQGSVVLPEDGTWTLRVASASPAAAIDYGYEVSGDSGNPVATTAPATPATTSAPATAATPSSGAAPSTTATAPEIGTEAAAARSGGNDDGSLPAVLLVIGAALVVAVAGVPLALRTIRNTMEGSNDPDDPETPANPPPQISD
jgi:hypothetical protein